MLMLLLRYAAHTLRCWPEGWLKAYATRRFYAIFRRFIRRHAFTLIITRHTRYAITPDLHAVIYAAIIFSRCHTLRHATRFADTQRCCYAIFADAAML